MYGLTPTLLLLDEDEFEADKTLNDQQRSCARQGLQDLFQMIATQTDPFLFKTLAKEHKM
jgi:hypothetical protein